MVILKSHSLGGISLPQDGSPYSVCLDQFVSSTRGISSVLNPSLSLPLPYLFLASPNLSLSVSPPSFIPPYLFISSCSSSVCCRSFLPVCIKMLHLDPLPLCSCTAAFHWPKCLQSLYRNQSDHPPVELWKQINSLHPHNDFFVHIQSSQAE